MSGQAAGARPRIVSRSVRSVRSARSLRLVQPAGSPPVRDRALEAAYEQCRRINAAYGKTYYLATCQLPRERRRHVWALYAFARVADQFVDDLTRPDPEALVGWSESALSALRASTPPHPLADPIVAATWHTMHDFHLPISLLEEFLASMAMDLTVTRYQSWEDLRGYMRGSAAVIGELMAPILGATSAEAVSHAGVLGEAFQLTNFVRDVKEDIGLGRIYLPQDDLAAHDVTEQMIVDAAAGAVMDERLRSLVRFEVGRADGLYEQMRPGLAMVNARSRPCLDAAFILYRGILREIEAADYDVFTSRATVPQRTRLATVGRVLVSAAGRRVRPGRG